MNLTFQEYQSRSARTAIYPQHGRGTPISLAYVGLGLGEVGEVQGKLKKVLRDDGGILSGAAVWAIAQELGDVLWYLAQAATEIGYPLHDVAADNLAKLADRSERGVLRGSGDQR